MATLDSGGGTETGVEPVTGCRESLLFTSARAAELLAVRESWLRRKAGRREIPCTFVGKYFRFSADDLRAIVTGRSHPARGSRPARGRRSRPRLQGATDRAADEASCCGAWRR